jgi:hypothetical protein
LEELQVGVDTLLKGSRLEGKVGAVHSATRSAAFAYIFMIPKMNQ